MSIVNQPVRGLLACSQLEFTAVKRVIMEIKTAGVGGGNLLTAHAKGEGRGELILSNPLDTDSEGAIKSVRINGVSVLSGFRKNVRGFLFPGAKQTVRNNEVSVL